MSVQHLATFASCMFTARLIAVINCAMFHSVHVFICYFPLMTAFANVKIGATACQNCDTGFRFETL